MTRTAACLLLVCLSAPAAARDNPLHSADGADSGGGRCPEVAEAEAEANDASSKPHASSPAQAPRTKAAKPVSARSGSDSPRISPPRWHSFLPGMFR